MGTFIECDDVCVRAMIGEGPGFVLSA